MTVIRNDLKKTDSCPFCHQKSAPTAILPSKAIPMSVLPSKTVSMIVFPSKLSIFSHLCQSDWPHCQISCSIDLSIHSSLPSYDQVVAPLDQSSPLGVIPLILIILLLYLLGDASQDHPLNDL